MTTLTATRTRFRLDHRFRRRFYRLSFILPAVIFVVVMMAFPVVYNGWLSFHEWTGSARRDPVYVGTENYTELVTESDRFFPAVQRTFLFTAVAVSLELVFGIGIALLLRDAFPGHNIIKTMILLPMVATPVAISMAWLLMLEPTIGVFNKILRDIGLTPQPFLGSQDQALWVLMAVDIWQWTPMMAMITLAGLLSLPDEPYEAALVDGATAVRSFIHITLPLLVPTLLTAVLLRSIEALKTFDIIYTMTRGGPGFSTETLNTLAYVRAFEYFRLGQASALLVVFFVIVLGVSVIFVQMRRAVSVRQAQ
ncbi:MAG: sugar ABC transporter permease [Chloroflexi bacterium]|jgi:multiple sugar transport system permease protein|nr:sugar ABC transporter permease [Chloroflexota bacterium]